MSDKQNGGGMGCWLKGCLVMLVMLLVSTGLLVWVGYSVVKKYTETAPSKVEVQVTPEELQDIRQRWETFKNAIQSDIEAEIFLSERDINAMITENPELKGKFGVHMESDQFFVQTSIPLQGIPLVSDRFANATFGITISIEGGRVDLIPKSIQVAGQSLPDEIMKPFGESFRQSFTQSFNKDPNVANNLAKIKSLQVQGDKLVIKSAGGSTPGNWSPLKPQKPFKQTPPAPIVSQPPQVSEESQPATPSEQAEEKPSLQTATESETEKSPAATLPPGKKYVGRTLDDVKRQLGQPLMTSEQGDTVTLYYKDVEIISKDGITVSEERAVKP